MNNIYDYTGIFNRMESCCGVIGLALLAFGCVGCACFLFVFL